MLSTGFYSQNRQCRGWKRPTQKIPLCDFSENIQSTTSSISQVVVVWSFPYSAWLPHVFSFFSLFKSVAARSDVLLSDPDSKQRCCLATGETGSSVQLEGADLSQKLLNKLFSPQLYVRQQDESTAIELLLLHAAAHGLLGMCSWRGCCVPGKMEHSMGAALATERVFATGHSDKTEPY